MILCQKIKNWKMSNPGPPISDFDHLEPVTMTVIISYDVSELNLPAIFALLPVTNVTLPPTVNFQRKQGKIRLPRELNKPGEILSMRYDYKVRGIIRSENAKSFSHSIIIDIGTSKRIISVKLSRSTLELTGPTSYKLAKEAAQYVLDHVKLCQENLMCVRKNLEVARKLRDQLVENAFSNNQIKATTDEEKQILAFFQQQIRGYSSNNIASFLDFILSLNRDLYNGTLKLGQLDCEMTNVPFDLGYSVNLISLTRIMNSPPFECIYSNAKNSSSAAVLYWYTKYERSTGQPKRAKHTIRVNKSGYVRHSGPNLDAMKPVYYAFMQRILQHQDEIKSIEQNRRQLKINGKCKSMTLTEWRNLLKKEEEFRRKVINGDNIPIASAIIDPIKTDTPIKYIFDLDIFSSNNPDINGENSLFIETNKLNNKNTIPPLELNYNTTLSSILMTSTR